MTHTYLCQWLSPSLETRWDSGLRLYKGNFFKGLTSIGPSRSTVCNMIRDFLPTSLKSHVSINFKSWKPTHTLYVFFDRLSFNLNTKIYSRSRSWSIHIHSLLGSLSYVSLFLFQTPVLFVHMVTNSPSPSFPREVPLYLYCRSLRCLLSWVLLSSDVIVVCGLFFVFTLPYFSWVTEKIIPPVRINNHVKSLRHLLRRSDVTQFFPFLPLICVWWKRISDRYFVSSPDTHLTQRGTCLGCGLPEV